MEKVYNKLVRDNIPEIIKGNNDGEAVTRILKLFVQDGLIKLQKGSIELVDVDALYDI